MKNAPFIMAKDKSKSALPAECECCQKKIKSPSDLAQWKRSKTYYNVMRFLSSINNAYKAFGLFDATDQNKKVYILLDSIEFI